MTLGFCYFRGPEADMNSLLSGVRVCSLCGQANRCFDLNFTLGTGLTEVERAGKVGCLECLRQDRFGFSHDTEAGIFVDEGVLALYEPDTSPQRVFVVSEAGDTTADHAPLVSAPKPHVPEEAIAELRRTLTFSTYQDIMWPVHHDDFMAYLGIWGPDDLMRLSPGDNGRSGFLEMVKRDDRALWPEGKKPLFGDNLVAFHCLHCQTYRGILDFD